MLKKVKKRWWTRKTLGVLLAKLILSGATDLAALTIPDQPVPHPVSINTFQTIR